MVHEAQGPRMRDLMLVGCSDRFSLMGGEDGSVHAHDGALLGGGQRLDPFELPEAGGFGSGRRPA